jgi:hypothetical protein
MKNMTFSPTVTEIFSVAHLLLARVGLFAVYICNTTDDQRQRLFHLNSEPYMLLLGKVGKVFRSGDANLFCLKLGAKFRQ